MQQQAQGEIAWRELGVEDAEGQVSVLVRQELPSQAGEEQELVSRPEGRNLQAIGGHVCPGLKAGTYE